MLNAIAIRTRTDHRAALREIEQLMDAKPNTSRGRRLDVLARLVEAYESRRDPIEPPSGATALRYKTESRVGSTRLTVARELKRKPALRR